MSLLGCDLRAGVFLEHDVAAGDGCEEFAVFRQTFLLVRQRFAQDLIDVVLVSLQQRADPRRDS